MFFSVTAKIKYNSPNKQHKQNLQCKLYKNLVTIRIHICKQVTQITQFNFPTPLPFSTHPARNFPAYIHIYIHCSFTFPHIGRITEYIASKPTKCAPNIPYSLTARHHNAWRARQWNKNNQIQYMYIYIK